MHNRARRPILIVILVLLIGGLAILPASADQPEYNLGLLPSNYEGPLYDMSGLGMLSLPSSVDLSGGLPPVKTQGSQNSCVGWAVAYYYKTYQEAQERGWNVNDSAHQFSPSFVYNQRSTNDCGVDAGMTMYDGLNIIKQKGAATLADFPYTCPSSSSCEACSQPSQAQLSAAYPYRSDSFSAIFSYQGGADINALKTLLASGQPFLVAVPVYYSFYTVTYNNPVVPVPAPGEAFYGGHAMLVVGYDDARGGFKTVNSWGSWWGLNGYCYLSYDFVAQKAWEGWLMTDHVDGVVATATPTSTPIPPTATPIPPTPTQAPPTNTPTNTPTRSWETATPTATPTATQQDVPNDDPTDPTKTPTQPTATPSAEPAAPSIYSGQVMMDGYPAPADTQVEVYMAGQAVATDWTEVQQGASRYSVEIAADDPDTPLIEGASEGDVYRFHVDGVEHGEDYFWHAGQTVIRDFFMTSASSHVLTPWVNSYGPAAGGWSSFETYPRLLGDVNGDGRDDIVAFGNRATYVSLSTGSSFGTPTPWVFSFGPAAGGWVDFQTFPRRLADVNGDGMADIVAFGNRATYVSLSTGSGFVAPIPWVFGYGVAAGGWVSFDTFPRQVADVNGDGMADIVAFGNRATYVSLSTGSSFGSPQPWVFGYGVAAGGWIDYNTFPRQMADVNGDGMMDIVAFGNRATYVSLSTGKGFGAPTAWVYAYGPGVGGWSSFQSYPRVMADMNGDGMADIVAFGGGATYVSLSTGSGFAAPDPWVSAYGTKAGGWTSFDTYPRDAADVSGDGRADLVGFADTGVFVDETTWDIQVSLVSAGGQNDGVGAHDGAEVVEPDLDDEPALRALVADSELSLPLRVAR